nr:unnamed protein product [Spirometra erinaceieuropaei]
MPFGLWNVTQTFQRFIDQVLRGLDFVYAHIDDLLVASYGAAEHEVHLRQLSERLDSFGVGATILRPLNSLLTYSKKTLVMTEEAVKSFNGVRAALARATLLAHPRADAQLTLMTDASSTAVDASLQQTVSGVLRPLAFFSKKLSPSETRYNVFGRELLAVYLSIRYFRHFIEGREFVVLTDHKPLVFALKASPDRYSPREIRQRDFIS